MVLVQSMRIAGGLGPWLQHQCRPGQCCNRRNNVCSYIDWTIEVDGQSKQTKFKVSIFCNPAAIQFSFFAIHTDCGKIAGLQYFAIECWPAIITLISLSPMKITKTQPNQSAIHQSRLRWDFQKQGNPPAIELIAGRMRSQWNLCNPGTIDRSTRNPEKTGRFRCYPQSNLT